MKRLLSLLIGLCPVSPALALDDAHYHKAKEIIARSISYLRAQQDQASGGWAVALEGER